MSYTAHDLDRWAPEPAKQATLAGTRSDARSPFARDRARVLHSAALRRLAAKTQVMGPDEGDVPRTRLTHSLEVAQIGRGIAEDLGADPDLVDTAGLAHDIGHPPFGHNGENALHALAGPCGGFEGNAQTLRILTRLEPKVDAIPSSKAGSGFETEANSVPCGLNLTRASLDAATKYPWPASASPGSVGPILGSSEPGARTGSTIGGSKFGVYADDLAVFTWLRQGAPEHQRCLEAQIMDWADDVAYSVHDLEDGVHSGRISLRTLLDAGEQAELAEMARQYFWNEQQLGHSRAISSEGEPASTLLRDAAGRLVELPALRAVLTYDRFRESQIALKRLTSELVGRFASAVVTATSAVHGSGPLTRYAAELVIPATVRSEVAVLKSLAVRYVLSDPERIGMQQTQRALLTELVEALGKQAPELLDPAFRPAWRQAGNDAERLRVVLDQVACLTDTQAVSWHHELCRG